MPPFPHIIQNFEQLATSSLRKKVLRIAEAGFFAINTKAAVNSAVVYDEKKKKLTVRGQIFDLKHFKKVICIGFGKSAFDAVSELHNKLGQFITAGYVIDLKEGDLGIITSRIGTHPYPTTVNIQATKELVEQLSDCTAEDLVLCVVSGGGSSLLCYPHDMTCEAEVSIMAALTVKGANIMEMNTVRKHISKVKGGNLAKLIYPATCISFIFSDVPGDDISMVASGPTVPDTTTMRDAAEILKKYNILEACQMPACNLVETPKEKKYFERVHNILIVSSKQALDAMSVEAENLGYKVTVYSRRFEGIAAELGTQIAKAGKPGYCLLGTGESTVQIKGTGVGGRNQEMALSALSFLSSGQVFAALASDGHDNSDAAGAIIDASTAARAKNLQLDSAAYLENNDSFHFFESVGDHIHTGLTGANVSDFFVLLED